MKAFFTALILGALSCVAKAAVASIQTTETNVSSDPLVIDSRTFRVVSEGGLELVAINARLVKPLNAWSLAIVPGPSTINVGDLASAIAQVVQQLPESNRGISSIVVPVFAVESLALDFMKTIRLSTEKMSGHIEPKSHAMFVTLRDFYRGSPHTAQLQEEIEGLANIRVQTILPGSEINFEAGLIGRPWSELGSKSDFGFNPDPSFVMVVDRNSNK